jgi:hypothetical protein
MSIEAAANIPNKLTVLPENISIRMGQVRIALVIV